MSSFLLLTRRWYIGATRKLLCCPAEIPTRQMEHLDIKGFAFQKGTVIGVHIDVDLKTISFSYNLGIALARPLVYQSSGKPVVSFVGISFTQTLLPCVLLFDVGDVVAYSPVRPM